MAQIKRKYRINIEKNRIKFFSRDVSFSSKSNVENVSNASEII